MTKPKKKPADLGKQTGIRLTLDMNKAIDRVLEQLRETRPGEVIKKSDAVRILLAEAITARNIPLTSNNA